MPLLLLLCVLPAVLGAVVEYIVCRSTVRRLWRSVPPVGVVLAAGVITLVRYHGWSADPELGLHAPVETLLFIPGLPAALLLVGIWLGWRLWKRRWAPRVIDER